MKFVFDNYNGRVDFPTLLELRGDMAWSAWNQLCYACVHDCTGKQDTCQTYKKIYAALEGVLD